MMNAIQLIFLLASCITSSMQANHEVNVTEFKIVVPEQFKLRSATNLTDHIVQMLAQNQTDYIKKIVSNEKEKKGNYPLLKKPSDVIPFKNITVEEYNHCRYLQLLFNETQNKNKSKAHSTRSPINNEAYKTISSVTTHTPPNLYPKEIPVKSPSYFFVTQQVPLTTASSVSQTPRARLPSVTTPKNQVKSTMEEQYFFTHTPNPKPRIKYVQYEPAILQKVIMDDGKVMYYKYNNPTMSYYMPEMNSQTFPKSQSTTEIPKPTELSTPVTEYLKKTTTKNLPLQTTIPKEVTEATTKFLNYEVDYGTPSTPSNPYINTMKFVIPVPYTKSSGITTNLRSYPWFFINPYQYNRNPMQRSNMQVSMPYVPIYNMIRTLTIPK